MTTAESTSAPRKRKVLRIAFLSIGAVIAAGVAWNYYWEYGPRPDIVFEGRVLDGAKAPLADVFVLVNVRSFTADFGHGHSGCAYGEVVQTDANGRFRFARKYNEVFKRKPNQTYSLQLGFYKPGWIPQDSRDRQSPGLGPDYLMIRDETSFVERGGRLNGMLDNNCNYGIQGKGWPQLWAAIYLEAYDEYCDESKPLWSDLSMSAFYFARRFFYLADSLSKQQDLSPLGLPRLELERRESAMSAWRASEREKFDVRFESFIPVGADIDVNDKRRVCEIFRIDGENR